MGLLNLFKIDSELKISKLLGSNLHIGSLISVQTKDNF